jgi:hypothetical protein
MSFLSWHGVSQKSWWRNFPLEIEIIHSSAMHNTSTIKEME